MTDFLDHIYKILVENLTIHSKVLNKVPLTEEEISSIVYDNEKLWSRVIKSNSIYPLKEVNYELLEFHGDNVLSTIISRIILTKYNGSPLERLTPIKNYLESNEFNSKLCKKLGLDNFILYNKKIDKTEAMIADVFEAFLGVLDLIITIKYRIGGVEICASLYVNVYKDLFIEDEIIITEKTELLQQFNTSVRSDITELHNPYRVTVKIITTPEIKEFNKFLDFFSFDEFLKDNMVIGKSTKPTLKDAENTAFMKAMNFFKDKGYTKNRMKIYKMSLWQSFVKDKKTLKILNSYLVKNDFIGYLVNKQPKWSEKDNPKNGIEVITCKCDDEKCTFYQLLVSLVTHTNFKTDALIELGKLIKSKDYNIKHKRIETIDL